VTSSDQPPAPTPAVAAVVIAEDAASVDACLAAVERQVYAASQVFVVGGDDAVRQATGEHEAVWRRDLTVLMEGLDSTITFVWFLRDRAQPRVDALRALITDGLRVDASVAGSKILEAGNPDVLVSVGYATDVFDAPYSGLQEGEVDQEQHDVVRDVASVAGISMLIRRDLFFGLRGVDPIMAPTAAAIDFCQRARLRGGRIVVIPSSEVLYEVPEKAPDWRERAGEIRSMLKVYSPVTLLWAIPLALIVGLLESVVGPFLGRWSLFGYLGAWGWNLVRLPSAIRSRFEARRGRSVGDEELFRYQVGGSARLRGLYDRALEALRTRFPEGILSGFGDAIEAGQQRVRRPAFLVGAASVLFALIATRTVWGDRLPVSGFSLPAPESAIDALTAYAGGWNPAGLGSPEVLHPSVGATALVQLVTFGRSGAAVAILTLGAFLAGVFGVARLLHRWGIGSVGGYLAGTVLMGGPAIHAVADAGNWAPVIGLAAVPWALSAALRPWPGGWIDRLVSLAMVAAPTGVLALFAPQALLIPFVAAAVWALAGEGESRLAPVVLSLAGAAAAVPLLMPWVLYADLGGYLQHGAGAYWVPSWPVIGVAAAALAGALVAGDRATAGVAGWGAVLTAIGALVARSGEIGSGRDVESAGLMTAALGLAVIAGAAIEVGYRRSILGGGRLFVGLLGVLGGLALVASTVAVAAPGRAGLPEDDLTGTFAFAAGSEIEPVARVLAFGSTETLPGTFRDLEGLGYRVFLPPIPASWDAYLNDPLLGDEALQEFLLELLDGDVRRAGEQLATFGIGWVAFLEPSPLSDLFEAQLDMVALRSFDLPVFRNEVASFPAVGDDGVAWLRDGSGYTPAEGSAASSLRIAENADFRWGPGVWEQAEWANRVTDPGSEVSFAGYGPRKAAAIGSAAWLGLLMAGVLLGRWRSKR
jgi:hypothetical protein